MLEEERKLIAATEKEIRGTILHTARHTMETICFTDLMHHLVINKSEVTLKEFIEKVIVLLKETFPDINIRHKIKRNEYGTMIENGIFVDWS